MRRPFFAPWGSKGSIGGAAAIKSLALRRSGSGIFQGIIDDVKNLSFEGEVEFHWDENALFVSTPYRSDKLVCIRISAA